MARPLIGDALKPQEPECAHPLCIPSFDAEAARGLSDKEVRRRWPRFQGVCPNCNAQVIAYASFEHFTMGDW